MFFLTMIRHTCSLSSKQNTCLSLNEQKLACSVTKSTHNENRSIYFRSALYLVLVVSLALVPLRRLYRHALAFRQPGSSPARSSTCRPGNTCHARHSRKYPHRSTRPTCTNTCLSNQQFSCYRCTRGTSQRTKV